MGGTLEIRGPGPNAPPQESYRLTKYTVVGNAVKREPYFIHMGMIGVSEVQEPESAAGDQLPETHRTYRVIAGK
jgi:hypothetical protein